MRVISRASDTLFVIAGRVGGMRSDYPDEWQPGDYEHAMSNGWQHFEDEPDFMYLDTPHGVHALHAGGEFGSYHVIHNPEGVSRQRRYNSPREIVDEVARRQQSGQGWSDYSKHGYQQKLLSDLNAARERGDAEAERMARVQIAHEKANEEAIAMGGSDLYSNLTHVLQTRGLLRPGRGFVGDDDD